MSRTARLAVTTGFQESSIWWAYNFCLPANPFTIHWRGAEGIASSNGEFCFSTMNTLFSPPRWTHHCSLLWNGGGTMLMASTVAARWLILVPPHLSGQCSPSPPEFQPLWPLLWRNIGWLLIIQLLAVHWSTKLFGPWDWVSLELPFVNCFSISWETSLYYQRTGLHE